MFGLYMGIFHTMSSWEAQRNAWALEEEADRLRSQAMRRQMEILRDIADYRLGKLIDLPPEDVHEVPKKKLIEGPA